MHPLYRHFPFVFRLAALSAALLALPAAPAQADTEAGDVFGTAVTSGDFNGDGKVDMAVGVPGQKAGAVSDAGAVKIFYSTDRDKYSNTSTLAPAISQDEPTVPGNSESGDRFGQTLAAGDFNGDGMTDLVVGAPFEDLEWLTGQNQGAVTVLYGSRRAKGLVDVDNLPVPQQWTAASRGGVPAPEERFGSSFAVGDFNCDRVDDLAIGSSNDLNGGNGSVTVLYGSRASGLGTLGSARLTLSGISSEFNYFASFGTSLAAGHFNADRCAELIVGIPNMTVNGKANAGAVAVLQGSANGIGYSGARILNQDSVVSGVAIAGLAEADDRFGYSLTTGDFDGDGDDDLAVGVPWEDIEGPSTISNSGAVNIIYSSGSGLSGVRNHILDQGLSGVPGTSESNDLFGYSLAAGRFSGPDHPAHLAIGVPGEQLGTIADAGAVNVVYGIPGNGLTGSWAQLWSQDNLASSAERGDRFGSALAVTAYRNEAFAFVTKADRVEDLIVGAPFEQVGSLVNAGVIHFVRGLSTDGLGAGGTYLLTDQWSIILL